MIRPHDRRGLVLAACLLAWGGGSDSEGDEPSLRRVPGWGGVLDPAHDCQVAHDPARDRVTIVVPATPHVLSAEVPDMPLSAPRVVQGMYGDFTATVRAVGQLDPGRSRSTHYDPYHGEGLLVWKNDGNYLRLERAVGFIRGRSTPYLNYEQRQGGRLVFSRGVPIPDHPIHLKVERADGVLRAWSSPDGSKWSALQPIGLPLLDRVDVGVVAINSSQHPLRAELERFRVAPHAGAADLLETTTRPPTTPAEWAGDRRAEP